MAAYAAVVSVMNTMDAVMNNPCLSTCFDENQIQSLAQKLGVMLQFIENHNSLGRDEEVESLERRISSAAHAAEDVIERHVMDQIHAGVLAKKAPTFLIDLYETMQEIDLIKEVVVKAEEKSGSNGVCSMSSLSSSHPPLITTGKTTMVGFDDYLLQLLDGLTGHESGLQVIPIVGMGGVGKTTLTRNAYEHSLTVQHFDVRAWVSISQQYNVKKILIQLLSTLGLSTEENKEGELSDRLYKYLFGRRYIIVLDDMWSITAWDKMKFCFPNNCNRSRIIVSTRLLEVANDLGSSRVVRVGLLDETKSWDLFCDKAFAQHEGCPAELEHIGKRIVQKCKGLPLSIVVIGALLRKSSRETEYWKNIVKNISSILSSAEDYECLDILCLSYIHLPAHLKPCFLYLGMFPEDHEIRVSQVIKLWVSEGFIKPNKDQRSLEEVAEGYINDLLERSLILVGSLGWNKKLESVLIHDLVRELCLREAQKENFLYVMDEGLYELLGIDSKRCIVVGTLVHDENYRCTVRSFQHVNTRFIECASCNDSMSYVADLIPQSIFLLWNLQSLIFSDTRLKSEAPVEIWKLTQLRHVEFYSIRLPEPSDDDDEFVLHNLQTLMTIDEFKCSEEVCKRIPNIKTLHLRYKDLSNDNYCLENVGRFNKLESLSYDFHEVPDYNDLLQNLTLAASLKKLSLRNCRLHWDDDIMRRIGSLPNLEYLKLGPNSFVGREWECMDGEFIGLKYLEIYRCYDLEKWDAESSHFPALETLVLSDLLRLEGIPYGIGDIPTLACIRLDNCSFPLELSLLKMADEQDSLGNDALQIQLVFYDHQRQKKFMGYMEMEGITCANFQMNTMRW